MNVMHTHFEIHWLRLTGQPLWSSNIIRKTEEILFGIWLGHVKVSYSTTGHGISSTEIELKDALKFQLTGKW